MDTCQTRDRGSHPQARLWSGLSNKSTSVKTRGRLWFRFNVNKHVVSLCDDAQAPFIVKYLKVCALLSTVIFAVITQKRISLTDECASGRTLKQKTTEKIKTRF